MLLGYFLNDSLMVSLGPVITSITSDFTFQTSAVLLLIIIIIIIVVVVVVIFTVVITDHQRFLIFPVLGRIT